MNLGFLMLSVVCFVVAIGLDCDPLWIANGSLAGFWPGRVLGPSRGDKNQKRPGFSPPLSIKHNHMLSDVGEAFLHRHPIPTFR